MMRPRKAATRGGRRPGSLVARFPLLSGWSVVTEPFEVAMRVPRVRFTVRWLIAVVVFVAILLSFPRSPVALFVQSLAVIILIPAGIAPTGHRIETAYWAMVLHPPLFV